jgi:hypothetical protein
LAVAGGVPYLFLKGGKNMPYYRKKRGTNIWHWCKNCRAWPKEDYDEEWHISEKRPIGGELCDQCKSKADNDDCKT